jgi:hypothetical protein
MAKLKLTADPTFTAKVGIPVPGGRTVAVEFTFRWRTKDALSAWLTAAQEDLDAVLDCACGWENDEPFDRENVATLLQTYPGAARAITTAYLEESSGARAKN